MDPRDRRLEAQFALSAILSSASSLADAAPSILETLAASLESLLAELWVVDPAGRALRCEGAWASDDLAGDAFLATTRGLAFGRDEGLPGRVWASGAPAWTIDVTRETFFRRNDEARALGLHAAVAFPIRFAGEVTGVAQFFYAAPRPPDAALLRLFTDVGAQIGLFVERTRVDEVVLRQAREIVDLSTPVLTVWDRVLAAPVIGTLEGHRANGFMDRVLAAIDRTRARVVLLDITGVPSVDTHVARHLHDTVRAAELLGARVVLTGVTPRVAYTLTQLGITMHGIETTASLADGLRRAMGMLATT